MAQKKNFFGKMGCRCGSCQTDGQQTVTAYVPFNFGNAMDATTGSIAPTGDYCEAHGCLPSSLYLHRVVYYVDTIGTAPNYQQNYTWDIYGNLSRDPDPVSNPDPSMSPQWEYFPIAIGGTTPNDTFDTPYTYAQAAANAAALLAEVALIAPADTYPVFDPSTNITAQTHLVYPSQSADPRYQPNCSDLIVQYTPPTVSGTSPPNSSGGGAPIVITPNAAPFNNLIENTDALTITIFGKTCGNGAMYSSNSEATQPDGYVRAMKVAFCTTTPITGFTQDTMKFDDSTGTWYNPSTSGGLANLPGEYILDPTDAPAYGFYSVEN